MIDGNNSIDHHQGQQRTVHRESSEKDVHERKSGSVALTLRNIVKYTRPTPTFAETGWDLSLIRLPLSSAPEASSSSLFS